VVGRCGTGGGVESGELGGFEGCVVVLCDGAEVEGHLEDGIRFSES
jgi:hypothetical protein